MAPDNLQNLAWYADMDGVGEKPVFAFFGPAWLINYVMVTDYKYKFPDLIGTANPIPI